MFLRKLIILSSFMICIIKHLFLFENYLSRISSVRAFLKQYFYRNPSNQNCKTNNFSFDIILIYLIKSKYFEYLDYSNFQHVGVNHVWQQKRDTKHETLIRSLLKNADSLPQ